MAQLLEADGTSDRLYTPKEMPNRVPGTTVPYWANLRFKGEGPKYLKLSPKKVLYTEKSISEWLASTERSGTAEVA